VWRHWLHHREAEGGGVFQEERSFLEATGGYNRSLTRRFFGFGPDSEESAETSYRDESFPPWRDRPRRTLQARPAA
jgi:hypothetical protein